MFFVDMNPSIQLQSSFRTCLYAYPALYAGRRGVPERNMLFDAFRVLTPWALEGATFQEQSGADSGTIMDGKAGDGKDCPVHMRS